MTRRSGLCLVALAALALAPGGSTEVPWPHGSPPTGAELRELIDGAVALADLERSEEYLEAQSRGDDHEHIFLLQPEIDLGLHDNDSLFRFGDGLFGHEFRREDGYAASVFPQLQRVHDGVRGGLDTFSCAGCHSVGGPDGAGGPTQNAFLGGDGDRMSSANPRNAPAVLGLGLVQAVAAEMTSELKAQRDAALAIAADTGAPTATSLSTKSVDFGMLIAMPDGSLDTSGVEGVSEDLVVRPFGWKGSGDRLRRFIEDAARIHFGVQSHVLTLVHQNAPDVARLGSGPDWFDPDGDGIARELEEGILTAGAVYLALLETPVILPPRDPELVARWGEGAVLFETTGCADCHRVDLVLKDITWEEWPDTTVGPPHVVNLLTDGEQPRGSQLVKLFSDLKRHAMGEELADPHDDESGSGLPRDVFLTRPLWGLAETAPYLHDGRAATIPEAILAHGGEAQASRDAFVALEAREQASMHIFLLSLTREPKVRVAR